MSADTDDIWKSTKGKRARKRTTTERGKKLAKMKKETNEKNQVRLLKIRNSRIVFFEKLKSCHSVCL